MRWFHSPLTLGEKHRLYSIPPSIYVPIVPNIISINMKRIIISSMIGRLFKMVETSELIPGIELIVLNGLRILITLIAEMSFAEKPTLIQPSTTTRKSRIFQVSLR